VKSTREQEMVWRQQAEADKRAALELAAELYIALNAVCEAVGWEEEEERHSALRHFESSDLIRTIDNEREQL
jgi:hypothetical protein